ncbi:MAG TPA: glycosyltransferase family 4 protein [Cellvibrionaceae bacterium]|nr:glycosyltransferase family 4 protein [Cellvibrionaceae bacterium]HMW71131.1 glycosyltransferase family 4 protein [Cellvibrionaceae bacterium]HNG59361.1 glycosyltransferase family 4 protein [Cellvibrionaceae bacterium]
MAPNNLKIVYFFNHPTAEDERKIASGEIPSDRLYAMVELKRRGWQVDACDERLSDFEYKMRPWMSWINWACIKKAMQFDVWLVKDNFSFILSILARLFGKKLLYIDSLFHYPKSRLRRASIWLNVRLAQQIGVYSHFQADFWSRKMSVSRAKFRVFSYTVDHEFYLQGFANAQAHTEDEAFVLATGRDMGRDFATLIEATARLGIGLKLVTLPYLLPKNIAEYSHVQILQRISYAELFALYRDAAVVAVPLRDNIEYPSGIRAGLEAMLLGRPTLCTQSEIINEYTAPSEQEIVYCAPHSVDDMARALSAIIALPEDERQKMCQRAQEKVLARYSMAQFVAELEQVFHEMAAEAP